MTIYISSNPVSLVAIKPTHTVEAEYGLEVVKGSVDTLAHHGPRASNPCPCLGQNLPKFENPVIGVSHIDLDTLGGILRVLGVKPWDESEDQEDWFWRIAAAVDTKGVHKMHEIVRGLYLASDFDVEYAHFLVEEATDQLNAFWAWSEANRLFAPRDGSVSDVTEQVMEAVRILQVILEADSFNDEYMELYRAGQAWYRAKEALNESSFVSLYEGIILRSADVFVNHLYETPTGEVVKAVVTFNTRTSGITVSLADPIEGFSCCDFMYEVFGPLAGGHAGIAGTPRGEEFKPDDAKSLVKLLSEQLK